MVLHVNPGHCLNPPFSFIAMCPWVTSSSHSQAIMLLVGGYTPNSYFVASQLDPTPFPSSLNSYDCHSLLSHAWSHLIVLHNTFINLRTIKCTSFEGWKSICILSQISLLCACSKFPSYLSACLYVALVLPCTLIWSLHSLLFTHSLFTHICTTSHRLLLLIALASWAWFGIPLLF